MNAVARAPARICLVLHDLRGGGAERAFIRLAQGMLDAGRRVDIVLVRAVGEYMNEVPAGADVVSLNRPHVWKAVPALARYISAARPRAVLSALTHVNIATIAAARLATTPTRIFVSERNQISAQARSARHLRQRIAYAAAPAIYRAADGIIAVSSGVAEDVIRYCGLPRRKVHVIYNPVIGPDLWRRAGAEVDHPWFAAGGDPVVLAVGRLHEQKDFGCLLDAFAIARSRAPMRLMILGEGELRGALEAHARALQIDQYVALPGFVPNPFAYMSRAAVFVLSSRWEGFPNVLVEAMACGLPVVATDCKSGPREILDDGRFGRLVPVGDPSALAQAILDLVRASNDNARSRGRAASYSVASAASRYLKLLES
jgi:glycosyltransferase involved in cell wall biosynthesis